MIAVRKGFGEVMNNREFWQSKIGGDFALQLPSGGQKFKVLAVEGDSVVLEREDSWTFSATSPELNEDGTVQWAYSSNGRFTDEMRLQAFVSDGAGEYSTAVTVVDLNE